MSYRIHSRDYLHRARLCLDNGTPEYLFYAAFELRSGIEARLQQYLEAQKHISNKLKKGWKIAQLARNIDKAFSTGDKIVEFAIYDREKVALLQVFYYTPVNSKLRKLGEQLGNYLHAMKTYRPPEDKWWLNTRNVVETCFEELRKANIGTLLGVPLLHRDTKMVDMSVEPRAGQTPQDVLTQIGGVGAKFMARVSYLNEIPESQVRGT